ncbi:MAG: transglycosylase SLT domain-containing protein [Crocinitomicaceae bacterium]|nr:transglycosylase SLT domain-containing protein [Crocinitomicaceae bacterium]MDG1658063.1 transglycosylase SLT domain-containing protein [Crocinitomicaceae bacterium]MDG2440646.1 transglycosylase SLT domain-containing protein [Crocinitomicaceae bacterium]
MRHFLLLISFAPIISIAQPSDSWDAEKIEVKQGDNQNTILSAEMIYDQGWDELAQPIFWKQIMQLSSDSCLVNIGSTREIIEKTSLATWNSQTKAEKASFRDSIKKLHGLPQDAHVYVTSGKSDFYKFQVVYPSISEGVAAFERFEVDPWYAQAILLIESPGQLKKSRAGAYGPFQLMPAVARAQGLTVNRYTDERKDFERSAYGASRLIHRVCIPEAKRILNARNLAFDENDLWFRLFVLHVYHAGAGNVSAVIAKINPSEGGQSLIRSMWVNSAAQFGNNSQNYTQLALASQLILDEMVHENYDYILRCSVD